MERHPYPNESEAYREARNELLDAEEALRTQVEKVAEQRRGLPLGGEVKEDYVFEELALGGTVTKVRLISSVSNSFQFDYLAEAEAGAQQPMANVFVRREGKVFRWRGGGL